MLSLSDQKHLDNEIRLTKEYVGLYNELCEMVSDNHIPKLKEIFTRMLEIEELTGYCQEELLEE